MKSVTVLRHPLVDEQLQLLRDKNSDITVFRSAMTRLGYLLAVEATKDAPVGTSQVTTPLGVETPVTVLQDNKILLVPILRAGLGLVDSFLSLLPKAKVAHIGVSRDHQTLEAKLYVNSLPKDLSGFKRIFVLDPMLATGNSCVKALEVLTECGADAADIKVICAFAVKEGLDQVGSKFPQTSVITAVVDPILNNIGYISPGCGDAGDRLYLL
ncbi:uracil phosphoribosyltransferase [Desulforamulus hydrothermalis]|uniref:Uracil phosphoribosyltransferase n=1 Tax=Desulforamulus hydrothermalis Lam5 = DSM 18033 TaxID=1121428 RepID=K8DXU5_9FIRM|nr:uracil phosphoribosyltransferase [Desulforamulus hydrothermalis]CCO07474.1 Uracil phosphoribosyltransferase [Desulforamulus hydrothermalis Lam5 = DSM 18033]SHH17674.1 uracil phosphoribosyltransferase [Desulforamulus hydrothermalis Lam5 = DSM 18033]